MYDAINNGRKELTSVIMNGSLAVRLLKRSKITEAEVRAAKELIMTDLYLL